MSQIFVVGVDGSEGSARAARFAAERAKLMPADLKVLYVIDWSPYKIYTHQEAETRGADRKREMAEVENRVLQPLLVELSRDGLKIDGEVRYGHPSRLLIDYAKEVGAQEIYVGRQGRSPLNLIFGSTTSHLVQICPIPVMVVP
ncbi:universal stress protein [Salinicola avicenniae]|uniref:universal stress protein n=1 Tax=Salinicola avicenniae TaxID=2916836 RepID=UPI002072CEEC|nr:MULTISPECIES: universal stress protein [unclassified Salinicola]